MKEHKESARMALAVAIALAIALGSTPIIQQCDSLPQQQESNFELRSPALNGRELRTSSQLFRQNGRLPATGGRLVDWRHTNLFQCDEPTRELFDSFAGQYNRSFQDASDKLERLNLFAVTLKRAILLNRVIQHEVLKESNYLEKPEVGNYHFVEATRGASFALWFADITDCELGLIKKTIFDIFYHLDANDYAEAYRLVQLNRDFLPGLLSEEGFEQLVNILLVRLYDRFQGDRKMNQLFSWPLYLKRLAAFVYNRQQALEAGQRTRMALVGFAYPAFFKDLKYNVAALNRTGDNVRANQAHELFFKQLGRHFGSLGERNKRLAIFRQRWSLLNALNARHSSAPDEELAASRARHASQLPDWLRVQLSWDASDLPLEYNASSPEEPAEWLRAPLGRSERLRALGEQEDSLDGLSGARRTQRPAQPLKLTEFSDLTDLEFVAFLSNDFSLLAKNHDSIEYLTRNFPLRQLDSKLRWELAHELELRRALVLTTNELQQQEQHERADHSAQASSSQQQQQQQQQLAAEPRPLSRTALRLAKEVVDELIGDVGLPIGPASLEGIQEEEFYGVFQRLAGAFNKSYARAEPARASSQFSAAELSDERAQRYQIFKDNYARFRAYMIKEGWQLDGSQVVRMLRLADLSWHEIKFTMFRLCCLSGENLDKLRDSNVTIDYLSSNYDLLCQVNADSSRASSDRLPVGLRPISELTGSGSSSANQQQQQQQQQQPNFQSGGGGSQQSPEQLNALEVYYYYSVHFNKHHAPGNKLDFERRLATFERNLHSIRRHSCLRSLTLFNALHLKRAELLNNMDVLDARRSHTDDLNLDRFHYFRLPSSPGEWPVRAPGADLVAAPYATSGQLQPASGAEPSRASISYRREPHFGLLLNSDARNRYESDQQQQQQQQQQQAANLATQQYNFALYSDKLLESLQNSSELATRYRENKAQLVYELVMARYKFCMKHYENIDLEGRAELRQQCQASGPLGDGATKPAAGGFHFDSLDAQSGAGGRLRQPQQADRCAYYRQGLEPWAAGLIRQDARSVALIRAASCELQ